MAVKEYRGGLRVFARLRSLPDAWKLAKYLVNKAIPFEFMPVPDDMYDVLTKTGYSAVLAEALDKLGIKPETTGRTQEMILETTKVYRNEGVSLRDVR